MQIVMDKDISLNNFTPNNRTKAIRMQMVTARRNKKRGL